MKVTLRCFASVRELLGRESLVVEVPDGTTVGELKERLAEDAPALLELPMTQAVNQSYATADQVLADGDEVAFIPPISGGDSGGADGPSGPRWRFDLVSGELRAPPLVDEVTTPRDGAVVVFAGVTRDHNEGRAVRSLRYEAYGEMAERTMEAILADVASAHAVGRIRVAHRLGEVPVGETSVLVVVAAEHRGPAFDAARAVMDRLKAEVPIFKQEHLDVPGGGARWVGDLPDPRP